MDYTNAFWMTVGQWLNLEVFSSLKDCQESRDYIVLRIE